MPNCKNDALKLDKKIEKDSFQLKRVLFCSFLVRIKKNVLQTFLGSFDPLLDCRQYSLEA